MESVIALEELIKENESRAALQKRQLDSHESGENKLSRMSKASTEMNLEEATELVTKYKAMLEELLKHGAEEIEEKERLQAAAARKKYFDAQDSRIKLNQEQSNDHKLAAMRIIAELPVDVQFEDEELFEIATKSIDLSLPDLKDLSDKLESIRKDFQTLLKQSEEQDIQEIATIDYLIPIIVLHFYLLLSNVKENIEEVNNKALQKHELILKQRQEKQEKLLQEMMEKDKAAKEANQTSEDTEKNEAIENPINTEELRIEEEPLPEVKELVFSGFPKYQDWWIRELWLSHQAYFALFKWKSIINNLCMSTEQKKAWSIIFDRWIFVKKLLNDKGTLAYNYNFAFDSLLSTHAEIEEEIEHKNIQSMETIINEITSKEDFSSNVSFHNTHTPYLRFKEEKLFPKE